MNAIATVSNAHTRAHAHTHTRAHTNSAYSTFTLAGKGVEW